MPPAPSNARRFEPDLWRHEVSATQIMFAFVLGLLLLFFTVLLGMGLKSSGDDDAMRLGTVSVALLLGTCAYAARGTLRWCLGTTRVGRSTVHVMAVPAAGARPAKLELTLQWKTRAPLASVDVALEAWRRSDPADRPSWTRRERLEVDRRGPRETFFNLDFPVGWDALAQDGPGEPDGPVTWRLRVHYRVRRWPDSVEQFDVGTRTVA